ncbi:MAG: hypothetical protein RLZZ40_680 [Actinomycetota bacterium]
MAEQSAPMFRPEISHPRTVSELSSEFGLVPSANSVHADSTPIAGVTVVSSRTQPGDVFVALPGAKTHGANYAVDAIERGAVAVVTDAAGVDVLGSCPVPVFISTSPRGQLGSLSSWVYRSNENDLVIVGMTGTNGKTSTSFYMEELLSLLGVTSALSSTAEIHLNGEIYQPRLTTPESCEVHAFLAACGTTGSKAAIVEVSAQAMTHHRVDSVMFDVVGFTNLSHDHLDEYGTLDAYFAAKQQLFTAEHARRGVISLETEWGAQLALSATIPCVTVSRDASTESDWTVTIVNENAGGTTFELQSRSGEVYSTHIDVIGQHMASNAALAMVMISEAGWSMQEIATRLDAVGGFHVNPPGRIERIAGATGPNIFVDSGHTPDAISVTLSSVRRVTTGRLICLVGAGGNRDSLKRAPLGEISATLCDEVIVTDDNSRFEDPAEIRAEVLRGAHSAGTSAAIHEIGENRDAIEFAVSHATDGDSIVWLGLGNETYREVMGEKRPHSARDLARDALKHAGWL